MYRAELPMKAVSNSFGLCQWFHYLDYETVDETIAIMKDLKLHHLRTGISWADFHRSEGADWYEWLFRQLNRAGIEPLVSIWHTPPSIAEGGHCSGPPVNLQDYADFVAHAIDLYGDAFEDVELWNEPNNRIKWNFLEFDPQWEKFARMVNGAAREAKARGKRTVLGGMIPVDHHWLRLVESHGGLDHMDVIAIHAFPGMWWNHEYCWEWKSHWKGWRQKVAYITESIGERPLWVTETGFGTWDFENGEPGGYDEQIQRLRDASAAPAERVYWYSAIDLPPHRPCIEMTEDAGRVDLNEYHMGLVTWDGIKKPIYEQLRALLSERSPVAGAATAADHQ